MQDRRPEEPDANGKGDPCCTKAGFEQQTPTSWYASLLYRRTSQRPWRTSDANTTPALHATPRTSSTETPRSSHGNTKASSTSAVGTFVSILTTLLSPKLAECPFGAVRAVRVADVPGLTLENATLIDVVSELSYTAVSRMDESVASVPAA